MATREADMKQAQRLGQNLVLNSDSASPEVSSLKQEVREIPEKYADLKNQLTEQQEQLERIIQDSSVFQKQIRELELWVTEVSESTAMQEPISTNPKVVHKRLEQTEVNSERGNVCRIRQRTENYVLYDWTERHYPVASLLNC